SPQTLEAPVGPTPATLADANARAKQGAVTDSIFGIEVPDPYRSLEEDNDATRAWIDIQTTHAETRIGEWTHPDSRERLTALLRIPTLGGAAAGGDLTFFSQRIGDREQP